MDKALLLKQKYDSGEITNFEQAEVYLNDSEIVADLLNDFEFDILNLLNRLTEIAEIPFTYKLARVQKWLNKLAELSFCNDGFSITGKSDDILSCYNSMIVSVLLRMKYDDITKIDAGINWILKYQNVGRNSSNNWTGSRIQKYGGCMKKTPCYIGIVKAMIALSDYKRFYRQKFLKEHEGKLSKGLEYILDHQLFKRMNSDKPITNDILKLTYPFSYKTNIIEILRLMKDNHLFKDTRCNDAKSILECKKHKDGFWKVNSSYLPKCWVKFDKPKQQGLWISHEIEKILN